MPLTSRQQAIAAGKYAATVKVNMGTLYKINALLRSRSALLGGKVVTKEGWEIQHFNFRVQHGKRELSEAIKYFVDTQRNLLTVITNHYQH